MRKPKKDCEKCLYRDCSRMCGHCLFCEQLNSFVACTDTEKRVMASLLSYSAISNTRCIKCPFDNLCGYALRTKYSNVARNAYNLIQELKSEIDELRKKEEEK